MNGDDLVMVVSRHACRHVPAIQTDLHTGRLKNLQKIIQHLLYILYNVQ